jgi:hypothetical protein
MQVPVNYTGFYVVLRGVVTFIKKKKPCIG